MLFTYLSSVSVHLSFELPFVINLFNLILVRRVSIFIFSGVIPTLHPINLQTNLFNHSSCVESVKLLSSSLIVGYLYGRSLIALDREELGMRQRAQKT